MRKTAILVCAAFVLAACGGGDDDSSSPEPPPLEAPTTTVSAAPVQPTVAVDTSTTTVPETLSSAPLFEDPLETEPAPTEEILPGEGLSVTVGRATWSTGWVQPHIYKQLLEELGYEVSEPADSEHQPDEAYVLMAQGEMDFWTNGWYPSHLRFFETELSDSTTVRDHITPIGDQTPSGGLEGFLVTAEFADEYSVYTLDELERNPDAIAAFDAEDPIPDNGVADIYGCPETYTCYDIITNQIAFAGWENIAQYSNDYDSMLAQAAFQVDSGLPMIIYTWAPSSNLQELQPGKNVYWIGMEQVLDDSNPAGLDFGEQHDQRGEDGSGGFARLDETECPSAAETTNRLCPLGWQAHDVRVTARTEFLDANPAARALFEVVELPMQEISSAQYEQEFGVSPEDLASQWISLNRDLADSWIEEALSAAN